MKNEIRLTHEADADGAQERLGSRPQFVALSASDPLPAEQIRERPLRHMNFNKRHR